MFSMVSFSSSFFREVACLALEALELKRRMNFLELLRLGPGLLVLGFLLVEMELAGLIPKVIVAGIDLDFAIIDIRHMGADLVQEMAVMGDDDYRVLEAGEKFLQPGDGLQVQLVGGFVQEQDVGVAEQSLGQ